MKGEKGRESEGEEGENEKLKWEEKIKGEMRAKGRERGKEKGE